MQNRYSRLAPFFCLCLAAAPPQSASGCDPINLDQGWTREMSEEFAFTSQGSRLMPYSWFMSLEVADPASQTLLRDPANFDRYGFIPAATSARNPDGLAIGFVKDAAPSKEDHIGLTCAACHTGSLVIAGQRVTVQGGAALSDFWMFFSDSVAALRAAQTPGPKFDRFSKRVLSSPSNSDLSALGDRMKAKLADLEIRLSQNATSNPYGYGRVDAFGHIFTRVLAQDFGIPENAKPPYAPPAWAPVSYPFLWDTPQLDLVQWNGSAPNSKLLALGPLGRNIGEVLGVFGELEVKPGWSLFGLFKQPPVLKTSANIQNLIRLEAMVRKLSSPAWPRDCLPLADAKTLARGSVIYEEQCSGCHRLLQDPERKQENRQIKAVLLAIGEVLTDPSMATNFAARRAKTGVLEGTPNLLTLGVFGPEASGHEILLTVVNEIMFRGIASGDIPVNAAGFQVNLIEQRKGFKKAVEASATPRYKARPLNGIWATAPYLHNGSVPTLADLLLSPDRRPRAFYVGSREFDAKRIGLMSQPSAGAFKYDTALPGNSNGGHTFGSHIKPQEKKDLLEFLKTL